MIWSIPFLFAIAANPEHQPWIGASELEYLTKNLSVANDSKKKSAPLRQMFFSVHLWSYHISLCTNGFCYFLILLMLPTFIDKNLQFGILEVCKVLT